MSVGEIHKAVNKRDYVENVVLLLVISRQVRRHPYIAMIYKYDDS
jgi:hypothetical protein